MKKCLLISIAICNFAFAPALFGAKPNQSVETVSIETVKKAIQDKDPNVTIVDVRDAASYAKGHITGAINLPPEKYEAFRKPSDNYPGLSKNGSNYVYCYNAKCHLARRACGRFNAAGCPSKEIAGGYDAWEKANYPADLYTKK